jgi:hypothetical protein
MRFRSTRSLRLAAIAAAAIGLSQAACGPSREVRETFRRIGHALETGDRDLFHAYVDVESVVASGLDAFLQRHYGKDPALREMGAFASGLVQATKPMLGLLVAAKIHEVMDEPRSGAAAVRGRIVSVRRDGERRVAHVELRTKDDEVVPLDVVLAPHDGRLRVVEVDVAALLDVLESRREPR